MLQSAAYRNIIMDRQPEREWITYRHDVAATRADAATKLAPRPMPGNLSPRAKAALQRARKRR